MQSALLGKLQTAGFAGFAPEGSGETKMSGGFDVYGSTT
jgi:hypothetical protein